MKAGPEDFNTELSGLSLGKNEITILAKNTKPKLEIIQPADNKVTDCKTVVIKGKTEPETFVLINDKAVNVDSKYNFVSEVSLNLGKNTIIIYARDFAGNIKSKTLTVIYQ